MNDLEYFARIAGDNAFRQWLEAERNESIKYLTAATDQIQIYRAQGKVQLLEKMLVHLEKAKNLR
jgi:hypothetical protein